jgi:hypothetical protein
VSASIRRQSSIGAANVSKAASFKIAAASMAAVLMTSGVLPLKIASASAQQLDNIGPMAVGEPTALSITLCLWSTQRPAPLCHEVPLTPGAAGPHFVSMKACQDGQENALRKWRAEAGPVFGFTEMAGDGYRIDGVRCSPVAGDSSDGG